MERKDRESDSDLGGGRRSVCLPFGPARNRVANGPRALSGYASLRVSADAGCDFAGPRCSDVV